MFTRDRIGSVTVGCEVGSPDTQSAVSLPVERRSTHICPSHPMRHSQCWRLETWESPESATRLVAGINVPDGPLITAVIAYAQRLSEPFLFNHAMRSWLFAETMGRVKGVDYDGEVVAIGTILHDIGLTASVSGPNRFEVNGANAALSLIRGKGL